MQQYPGRPTERDRRGSDSRSQNVSFDGIPSRSPARLTGEPAKFNTRSTQQRISWENDLYERQSI